MGKIILLISLFSLTLGVSQNKKSNVYFEIEQKQVRDSTWLKVKLVNNSNQNIWIALDTVATNQNRNLLCFDAFFKGIKIQENFESHLKGEPGYSIVVFSDYRSDCFNDSPNLIDAKSNLVLVKKKNTITFSYFFTRKRNVEKQPEHYKEYIIEDNVKKEGYTTLSFNYLMSEEWVERYIKKELLRELEEEHYIPFKGCIRSNEVKFLFSEGTEN